MAQKLTFKELVELVNEICNPELSDEELSNYISILEDNVPHPAPSDLIFWNDASLTPKEIVEIALSSRGNIY